MYKAAGLIEPRFPRMCAVYICKLHIVAEQVTNIMIAFVFVSFVALCPFSFVDACRTGKHQMLKCSQLALVVKLISLSIQTLLKKKVRNVFFFLSIRSIEISSLPSNFRVNDA